MVCGLTNNGQRNVDMTHLDPPVFDYRGLKLNEVKSDFDPVKLGEALPLEIHVTSETVLVKVAPMESLKSATPPVIRKPGSP